MIGRMVPMLDYARDDRNPMFCTFVEQFEIPALKKRRSFIFPMIPARVECASDAVHHDESSKSILFPVV